MATKTDKANKAQPKRESKSKRLHIRRVKQEAHKVAGTTPTHS